MPCFYAAIMQTHLLDNALQRSYSSDVENHTIGLVCYKFNSIEIKGRHKHLTEHIIRVVQ